MIKITQGESYPIFFNIKQDGYSLTPNMILDMEETGAMVTTWETKALKSGKTYNAKIEVQLSTGERPVIFDGALTMDK